MTTCPHFSSYELTILTMFVLYDRYTEASGLNIHVWKSTYYIFNCSPDLYKELQRKGISTPGTTFSALGFGTYKQHEHYTSRNLPKD
jgi:hypothetical protein